MIYLHGFPSDITSDLTYYLSATRHHAVSTDREATSSGGPHIIIMDSDAIHDITQLPQHTPYLLSIGAAPFTAQPSAQHKHLLKPVDISEIDHIIMEWLKQGMTTPPIALLNDWLFDHQAKMLRHADTENTVTLTDKETGLLRILVDHAPNTIDRDSLLKEVWGYEEGIDTHTLETHIYRLRSKLSDLMPKGKGLMTSDAGYRFEL